MKKQINVMIGIQARSTSERFPNKCMAEIAGKPMLQYVLDSCHSSVKWLSTKDEGRIRANVVLLVPTGDPLGDYFGKREMVIEGPEHNVLSRYEKAFRKLYPDFVVRITGDCPLIPDNLISKHITTAVYNRLDYVHNVNPNRRNHPDGYDVECMSQKIMTWLFHSAQTAYDQEHVTTLLRSDPPPWALTSEIRGQTYLGDLKLSVDTFEEFQKVKHMIETDLEGEAMAKKANNGGVFYA